MKCHFSFCILGMNKLHDGSEDLETFVLGYDSEIASLPEKDIKFVFDGVEESEDSFYDHIVLDYSASFSIQSCILHVPSGDISILIYNSDTNRKYSLEEAKRAVNFYEEKYGFYLKD